MQSQIADSNRRGGRRYLPYVFTEHGALMAAHPDPASGKPFQHTKTDDGFELQSTFEFNEKPFKIRFK